VWPKLPQGLFSLCGCWWLKTKDTPNRKEKEKRKRDFLLFFFFGEGADGRVCVCVQESNNLAAKKRSGA
jgi:hypothetical protein